ncbi:MAG TPA: hypothetical protein VIU38_03745 [Anaerolineales bacterium]
MKALARFTGIIFFLIGLVAVIGGAWIISGGLTPPAAAPAPESQGFLQGLLGTGPDFSFLLVPLRLLVGGSLSLQGLMLTAAAEVLWLAASVVDHSQRSSQHLATLAARGSMTIP